MTNKEAYEKLDESKLQWGRKDKNTIYVWTSGYHTNDMHQIEKVLMQAKMCMISAEFDKMCGKTVSYFKHK